MMRRYSAEQQSRQPSILNLLYINRTNTCSNVRIESVASFCLGTKRNRDDMRVQRGNLTLKTLSVQRHAHRVHQQQQCDSPDYMNNAMSVKIYSHRNKCYKLPFSTVLIGFCLHSVLLHGIVCGKMLRRNNNICTKLRSTTQCFEHITY